MTPTRKLKRLQRVYLKEARRRLNFFMVTEKSTEFELGDYNLSLRQVEELHEDILSVALTESGVSSPDFYALVRETWPWMRLVIGNKWWAKNVSMRKMVSEILDTENSSTGNNASPRNDNAEKGSRDYGSIAEDWNF